MSVEHEIEIDVDCEFCGATLTVQAMPPEGYSNAAMLIKVEPCDSCMTDKYEEGYEEGEEKGAASE